MKRVWLLVVVCATPFSIPILAQLPAPTRGIPEKGKLPQPKIPTQLQPDKNAKSPAVSLPKDKNDTVLSEQPTTLPNKDDFPGANQLPLKEVALKPGWYVMEVSAQVTLRLPEGWKIVPVPLDIIGPQAAFMHRGCGGRVFRGTEIDNQGMTHLWCDTCKQKWTRDEARPAK